MTIREMEDRLRQYEYAFHEIIGTLWAQAVLEDELRQSGAPLNQIQKTHDRFECSIAQIAINAMQSPPIHLM
jgi:hypothetical protein